MNTPQVKAAKFSRKRTLGITASVLAALVLLIGLGFYWLTHNYARDEAAPLEAALVAKGAVKECSSGDAGRGPDNYSPWYNAIFVVSGDRAAAADAVRSAASSVGLSLASKTDSNPLYDQFYLGDATKNSSHGVASYSLLVYNTRAFIAANDKKYCTTTKQTTPVANTTTVLLSVGLPPTRR